MSENWTKGPWAVYRTIETDPPQPIAIYAEAGRRSIANVQKRVIHAGSDQELETIWADCHLMAAAPDIYDALKESLEWADWIEDVSQDMEPNESGRAEFMAKKAKIERALAKARGES